MIPLRPPPAVLHDSMSISPNGESTRGLTCNTFWQKQMLVPRGITEKKKH